METTSPSAKKPSRRFHHKSRGGCRQCRGRKTKCDEVKPRCAKCVARGLVCSLLEGSLVIIAANPGGRAISPAVAPWNKEIKSLEANLAAPIAFASNPLIRAPRLELQLSVPLVIRLRGDETDMARLMYHYTTHTSSLIGNSVLMLPLWQVFVPQLAFNHEFLLHGLLAVTALQLNITNPTPEYANAALLHYTKTLASFRPHVGQVTEENAVAIFALSCLLPVYSFGVKASSLSPLDSISEITEVFLLMRGIRAIVSEQTTWLKASPFKHMLGIVGDDYDCVLPQEIENSLAILSSQNKMSSEARYTALFQESIKVLRGTFARAQDTIYNHMMVAPFPLNVPEEFFETLRERQPMALVILAHYGVILYRLREEVWFRGWGSRIVDAVKYSLGDEWKGCLEWPIRELKKV